MTQRLSAADWIPQHWYSSWSDGECSPWSYRYSVQFAEEGRKIQVGELLFTMEYIRDVFEGFSEFMALGAHDRIFIAWHQFDGWYQMLLSRKEEVKSDEPVEGEEGAVQRCVLEAETKTLQYPTEPGNSTNDRSPQQVGGPLLDEVVVIFWRAGLLHSVILRCSRYQRAGPELCANFKHQQDDEHCSAARACTSVLNRCFRKWKAFQSSTGSEKHRKDDELCGQDLWPRRSARDLLVWENGSGKGMAALAWKSAFCERERG